MSKLDVLSVMQDFCKACDASQPEMTGPSVSLGVDLGQPS